MRVHKLEYLPLFFLMLGCSRAESRISLCELVKKGEQYNERVVRVEVIYVTDLLEISFLTDPRCPGKILSPLQTQKVDPDSKLKEFDAAVSGQLEDLSLRKFSVDVSGQFFWNATANPQGSLYLDKVFSYKKIVKEKR